VTKTHATKQIKLKPIFTGKWCPGRRITWHYPRHRRSMLDKTGQTYRDWEQTDGSELPEFQGEQVELLLSKK
jgi:hypothetical protein